MTDHTNNGCSCTPNTSIRCAVTNCANHCKDAQYCGLNAIQVGTHEANPTMDQFFLTSNISSTSRNTVIFAAAP